MLPVLATSVLDFPFPCPKQQALLWLCSGMLNVPHPHPKEAAWGFQEMLWLPLLISTIYNPAQTQQYNSPSAPHLRCK